MPFIIAAKTLSQAWDDAQNSVAPSLRASVQDQRARATGGTMSSSQILAFEARLRGYRDTLDTIAAIPGLAAYVNALPNTPQGYDVVAQFSAMRAQVVATSAWIQSNFPRDSTNTYLAERSWGADGLVERVFTAAQLTNYVAQLDALLSTIG